MGFSYGFKKKKKKASRKLAFVSVENEKKKVIFIVNKIIPLRKETTFV